MTRKHPQLEQLDGNDSVIDYLDDDDLKTFQYWELCSRRFWTLLTLS